MKPLLVVALVAACGGDKPTPPHAPARRAGPPPPASCPGVVYACTDPAVGCFEGGEDFKAAMAVGCKQVGGTEAGHCEPAGTLGSCTVLDGLTATFHGCGTMWVRAGQLIQTADDARAQCTKVGGTWTTTP